MSETSLGLTQDEYRKLCQRAFENLPADTTVTMDDVHAILTWCLPEYDRLRSGPSAASLRLTADGPGARTEIASYVEEVIRQRTVPNEDTSAARLAQGITTSVLHRLGAGYSASTAGIPEHADDTSPAAAPWWEAAPPPGLAQCQECAVLVLETGLARHEQWHHEQRTGGL